MEEQQHQESVEQEHTSAQQTDTHEQHTMPHEGHASDGKLWAILGYIISILFFMPLVIDDLKNKPYSRFHANQQLVLLIVWIVGSILAPMYWLGMLIHLFAFVLMIIGVVNASKGEMKPLPLVGGIRLIK